MPHMDGFETTPGGSRSQRGGKTTPIIAVTASTFDGGSAAGAGRTAAWTTSWASHFDEADTVRGNFASTCTSRYAYLDDRRTPPPVLRPWTRPAGPGNALARRRPCASLIAELRREPRWPPTYGQGRCDNWWARRRHRAGRGGVNCDTWCAASTTRVCSTDGDLTDARDCHVSRAVSPEHPGG